ncbi:hypothetical protein PQ465_08085 [Sphingobacterium oryzagri]|uniref:DUF2383 domain-containing protein n=1 Tax=Sphingobacterium oryzagri TaxID=3025669 RepID=A0ABY7WL42_9SPHI|nr:hypothetical protein [Sphingobacterium sp. KACC 22765]WDF70326.1 hypothetical protein PQ465_08085 [Sphingobacterium sp. KACC 22765]
MKNTINLLKKLTDSIQHRSSVYKKAANSIGHWPHRDIRFVLLQYQEESQRYISNLLSFIPQKNTDNTTAQNDNAIYKLVKITPVVPVAVSELEITNILRSCIAIEESCKSAYQQVINEIDDSLGALAYELRRQADGQYMAYNHIKTLLDCNSLDLQAV